MTLRIAAAAALLLAAVACGDRNQPAPTARPAPDANPAKPGADGSVTGRLAPSVAPPSSLIALERRDGGEIPVKTEPAVMDQVSQVFYPGFLVAQAGQTIEFRNSEDVLHNIRVTEVDDQKPVFNVATPPYGKYQHTFERPGAYNVGCDIHPTMRADILVTTTPYTALADADGSFTISNVPPGAYTLTVYAGDSPTVRDIEVKPGATDLGVIQ